MGKYHNSKANGFNSEKIIAKKIADSVGLLVEDDVKTAGSSKSKIDIHLRTAVQDHWPYATQVKARASDGLADVKWLQEAVEGMQEQKHEGVFEFPILIKRKIQSRTSKKGKDIPNGEWVVLKMDDFLKMHNEILQHRGIK